jgi:TetR/AcrR family fatty acid metabolism transcriptional regulator
MSSRSQQSAEPSGGAGREGRGEGSAKDKRALILQAAISVFARNGYHGSRVSDIAREAGIAYGLVYHYFKNKEEILGTIFRERWGSFVEAVEAIAEGETSLEDRLLSIAALILNAYRVRPDWVKVLVFEIQRSPRFAEPESIEAVGRLFGVVTALVRDGQAKGELRPDVDPEVAANVFLGALDITLTTRVLQLDGGAGASSEGEYYLKVARTVVGIFLSGVAAGPSVE